MFTLVFAEPWQQPSAPRDPGSPGVHAWRDGDSRLIAWGHSEGREHWMHWPGLASFRFAADCRDITAFPAPGAHPDIIADTFLRTVVPMALQALGREALHASAVLGPRGIVAFCAASQTGKSTVAYGLARRGYPQWADDAVVVEMTNGTPAVSPLPFVVRLRPESADFYGASQFPTATAPVVPASAPAPLTCVCILERGVSDCRTAVQINRLEASQAFVALLAHAYCFEPAHADRKASMLTHYLELAARVPIFRLSLGDDLARLPAALDTIARFTEDPAVVLRRPGCAA